MIILIKILGIAYLKIHLIIFRQTILMLSQIWAKAYLQCKMDQTEDQ